MLAGLLIALPIPFVMSDRGQSLNRLQASEWDLHELIIDEHRAESAKGRGPSTRITHEPPGAELFTSAGGVAIGRGVYCSRVIQARIPFNEVIASWNVDVPEGSGFFVQLRVGRTQEDMWSHFYHLGQWGSTADPDVKILTDEHGSINVDYFGSTQTFDRMQYRVHLCAEPPGAGPRLRRFSLAYSNTTGDRQLWERFRRTEAEVPKSRWARRLPVPFRSQQAEDERIAGSICSPTSVAMVMAYHGVNQPTARVAETVYDREYGIYGNWARAIQAAYAFGLPGYVRRFSSWNQVKQHIARDQPIIASIRAEEGRLTGAPLPYSRGHLLVITGLDEAGNPLVNDPAWNREQDGRTSYLRNEFEAAWLKNGGVAYVILPRQA